MRLQIHIAYEPKFLGLADSAPLVRNAIQKQTTTFAEVVGPELAAEWGSDAQGAVDAEVPNLLTISLDDASGAYRGAGHRHDQDQHLVVEPDFASPGLTAGPLHPGQWALTLSTHTVAAQCDVSIQIGAEIASTPP